MRYLEDISKSQPNVIASRFLAKQSRFFYQLEKIASVDLLPRNDNSILRWLLIIGLAVFFTAGSADAQLSIHLGFNFETQPMWGPTGYDHVEYYYLPDIEVYYNVPQQRFYYYEGGVWIGRSSLPYRYRHYDFYNSYKVVVNDRTPYRNHRIYREKYFSYRGRHDQPVIRDSRDERYYSNKRHPEHNSWKKQQKSRERQNDNNGRGDKRNR